MSTEPAAPMPVTSDHIPADHRPGDRVGPYQLLESLGAGGMGEVWAAKQTEPVYRKVALKLIKPGMDSRSVLARFEQERQALALMDHPNIAKVFDGGLTDAGRPFFVMELVNGLPLTRFCDNAKLTPRQRLELFVQVCQAVQHAHTKGIVHRDLKPSNVLVTLYDGEPVPKVIDFGVAKATGGKLTDESLSTQYGAVIGTLEYMAPEQAGFSTQDIDTRADIYSLGVILYELLTGLRPFDGQRLHKVPLDEAVRILREEEPPRPSTRLSGDTALPSRAAARQTEPRQLMALMRGELDWVVMKCLEKDRNRRYETANGLARDVQRYLADEVVEARPPSAGYRLRKFVRRNKGRVVAAALVLLALLGGIAGTTAGMVEAQRQAGVARTERDQKEEARKAEEEQKNLAKANERKAKEEKDIADAVRRFLQNDLLRQADPWAQAESVRRAGAGAETAENPPIKELLDRAAHGLTAGTIEAKFPGQPQVQEEILETLGETYQAVGEYTKAIQHLERVADLRRTRLGPDHPDTLTTLHHLAAAYLSAGRTADAITLYEKVRDGRVAKLGPGDPATLGTLHGLGEAYSAAPRVPEAIAAFEQARAAQMADPRLGPNHPSTLRNLHSLAIAYRIAGRLSDAIPLLKQVRDVQVYKLGPEDPATITTLHDLAGCYRAVGRTAEAVTLFEKVRDAKIAKLGANHPRTLVTLNNLAGTYQDAGRLADSVALYEQIRDAKLANPNLGPDHPSTLLTLHNLGRAYRLVGRTEEAITLGEQVAAKARQKLGVAHPNTLIYTAGLASTLEQAGRTDRAVAVSAELLAAQRQRLPADDPRLAPRLAGGLALHGRTLLRAGQPAEAEPVLRECLAIREKKEADSWTPFEAKSLLGGSLLGQKKYADAEPLLRAGYEGLKARQDKIPPAWKGALREAADRLAELCQATGRDGEAAKWRELRTAYGPKD